MPERFVIGTRGSKLALWQTETVGRAIMRAFPEIEVEIRVRNTTGDINLASPLAEIGDKGLFTRELETDLLLGEVDMCVHSLKDLETEQPEGCVVAGVLPRADARDVLVCGPRIQAASLAEVPEGSRIGTGSRRRVAQLKANFPNVVPEGIRGNVDTRVAKAEGDDYEGAILAAAGMKRMGYEDHIAAYLPIEDMIPAPGQGAIAMEVLKKNERAYQMARALNDPVTKACTDAERFVLFSLEGGCSAPIGAHCRLEDGKCIFDACVLSLGGTKAARCHLEADADSADPMDMAWEVVSELIGEGARAILRDIKNGKDTGQ
ncbi:hydroxymethylbilane synthase [Slackia heliotrinireducens]|uniref:hydroxymethylbilane synthase n=1 Tax=Slackia heliotrinireducens TaxID=84110 RepID=UPI003315386F